MRSRYRFLDERSPHFITSTIVEWIPVFTKERYCDIIMETLAFYQKEGRFETWVHVIMDNHLHLIVAGQELSHNIKAFKSFTARRILEQLQEDEVHWMLNQFHFFKKRYKRDADFQVWQEGVHPQQIFDEAMLKQKADYIHYNPVRRGLVEDPRHWRYSSAREYMD